MENCKNGLGIKDQKVRMKFFYFLLDNRTGIWYNFYGGHGGHEEKTNESTEYWSDMGVNREGGTARIDHGSDRRKR